MPGVFVLLVIGMLAFQLYVMKNQRGPRLRKAAQPSSYVPAMRFDRAATDASLDDDYLVAGKPFACTICENRSFEERNAQLNTAGMTMLGLDWANRSATCLVCQHCGYVHWFVDPPQLDPS